MLELGLRVYEIKLRFFSLFTSYEMELKIDVHVQIENQLGFNELQNEFYKYGLEVMIWE